MLFKDKIIFSIVLIFLFIASFGGLMIVNLSIYQNESKVLSHTLKRSLQVGNYRDALLILSDTSDYQYSHVSFHDSNGSNVFDYPPLSLNKKSNITELVTKSFSQPIMTDENYNPTKIGVLQFSYFILKNWQYALALYFLLLILSLFLMLKYERKLQIHYQREEKNKKNKIVAQLATQVAHDIRSPLSSLDIATESLSLLPEEDRIIIRSAIQQIKGITYRLIAKNNNTKKEALQASYLPELVKSSAIDKRYQFSQEKNKEITIKTTIPLSCYNLFSKINEIEMKRVISNLVNNAKDAIPNKRKGEIIIGLKEHNSMARIYVKDNGEGIPFEIQNKIMNRGNTFYKKEGLGIGLAHAKEVIEKHRGSISFESTPLIGTTFYIDLEIELPPRWFTKKIIIPQNSKIIVLDDDQTIHSVWSKRLSPFLSKKQITISHFYTSRSLKKWLSENDYEDSIFFFDFQLSTANETGLDLIEQFGLIESSYLITSHSTEEKVLNRCISQGVKLIPKTLAQYFPIEIKTKNKFDAIHIEDNNILRMAWLSRSKKAGLNLFSSNDPRNIFIQDIPDKSSIPIYIDQCLEQSKYTGTEWAKKLYKKGFHNIYLSTGFPPEKFSSMFYIKKIIGKECPF